MSDRENTYATLVSLGLLRPAKAALLEARDLLESIGHPLGADLRQATLITATVEHELLASAAEETTG